METFLSSLAFMALALAQIAAVIAVHAENERSQAEPSDSPGGAGATRSKTIRPTGGDAIGRRRVNWAEAEMGSALPLIRESIFSICLNLRALAAFEAPESHL